MKGEFEDMHMEQAIYTVELLKRMESENVTSEKAAEHDVQAASSQIRDSGLRLRANAAMGRVVSAGGMVVDLFGFLYGIDPKDEVEAEKVAEAVIAICELRIKELQGEKI